MNRRARQSTFAWLALLAALLLATVPTLGRLYASVDSPVATSMAHMRSTAHGMDAAMARAMDHATHAASRRLHPPGHARHAHDADCAYCPLLAATVAGPMHALAVASASAPASAPPRLALVRVPMRLHGTLGSRGPPAA
jgi:hypothetical protein